jgi:hypothetical protein
MLLKVCIWLLTFHKERQNEGRGKINIIYLIPPFWVAIWEQMDISGMGAMREKVLNIYIEYKAPYFFIFSIK